MFTTLKNEGTQRRIATFAWAMAWFGLVMGQLHALARFATVDGKGDLEADIVRAWAVPAADWLSPLLDWASPDTVYFTYGKLWLPVFVGFTLAAFVVHQRRRSAGFRGAEKSAWRIVLTAYLLACVGAFAEYWTQWGDGNEALLEAVFVALMPVLLVTMLGSSVLGVVLVRRGLGAPAWLLALTVPLLFAVATVTSLGNVVLPISFGMAMLARRLVREPVLSPAARSELGQVPSL